MLHITRELWFPPFQCKKAATVVWPRYATLALLMCPAAQEKSLVFCRLSRMEIMWTKPHMRGGKYDDIANLSFANKVLVLFFDEAGKKQEVWVDLAGGKNAVVACTPPLHHLLLRLLRLSGDSSPGTKVGEEGMTTRVLPRKSAGNANCS